MFEYSLLLKKLQEVLQQKIPLEKVEAYIGEAATINTLRSGDRDCLLAADIGPDTDYQADLSDLSIAKNVVYWSYGENDIDDGVRVIGLIEHKDDMLELFYGLVYAPE